MAGFFYEIIAAGLYFRIELHSYFEQFMFISLIGLFDYPWTYAMIWRMLKVTLR